jgi:YqaJ-like viral recombinase domain
MTGDLVSPCDAACGMIDKLFPVRAGIERFPITDRETWKARRKQDNTASVAGALLGVHEYMTEYELWMLKAGRIDGDPEETPAMERGRLLEDVARKLVAERHPTWSVVSPAAYYRDPKTRLGATPDAFVHDPLRPGFGVAQIKSVEPSIFRRKWIDGDGVIAPPLWIAVQAIIECHLTGASWAIVVPMRVGHGLYIDEIDIPLRADLISRIEAETAAFWRSIEANQPPDPDAHRDAALIEQLYQPSGKMIDLSADNLAMELADAREACAAALKYDKDRLAEIKSELLLKLGGASAARLADGRMITAKRTKRSGYTVKPTEFIDLRIKKRKSA